MNWSSPLELWVDITLQHTLRYFFFSGLLFVMTLVLTRSARLAHRRVQARAFTRKQLGREIVLSLSTFAIFGVAFVPLLWAIREDYSQIYMDPREKGLWYLPVSVGIMVLLHDAYFYWTHRLMHARWLYRPVHLSHHRSNNPSSWAAFAFHPWEALIELGIFPIILFLVPAHPFAVLAFLAFVSAHSAMIHCGYEIFPRWVALTRAGGWLVSATHHNLHHQFVTGNYGLYFSFWDRWMGTQRSDYDERVHEVIEARSPASRTPLGAGDLACDRP